MIDALTLGAITVVATAVAGFPTIGVLKRLGMTKEIGEFAPESHTAKAGTPTAGGILIVLGIAAVTLAANFFGHYSMAVPLLIMGPLAVLGFVDDLGSLHAREQRALRRRVKFIAFVGTGVAAAVGLYHYLELDTVNIPYDGRHDLGIAYAFIAVGLVVLTAGGVAVTDGLDGLATGTSAIAYGAYGFIAATQGQDYIAALCFTVAGACLGFLWHNSFPARVFMGDAGALPLGGGLAVVAFMTGQWLVLPLIAVIFWLEGASVALQVFTYRFMGGRRFLKQAPLHHHFERLGWSEVQVTQRFWIIGALGAAVGVILALEV